ncbi:MAG: hypothetical protein SFV54_23800 [Bryobacteraceae bacterium]|nr:hypothetical protein [Bryobacteraceae bacterium]
MKTAWSSLNRMWCQLMHPSPMWPVNGQYRCPECMRVYQVPWEERAPGVKLRELERPAPQAFEHPRTLKHAPIPVTAD